MLSRYELERGSATALLPLSAPRHARHNFDSGGILPRPIERPVPQPDGSVLVPKPNSDRHLSNVVRNFISKAPNHVCVLEDHLHRPGDPFVATRRSGPVIIDEVIFHILGASQSDDETIISTVRASGFIYMTLGVLAASNTMDSLDLGAVANSCEAIFVDAYDGESYILWRPTR